jgi:hypothetical protein
MLRKLGTCALIVAMACAPLAADGQSQPSSRSNGKRVLWTIVGAAAGFGAGVYLGLNKFDDAVNSDRKVWTTALVGAAAGGVTGAILSRNIGRGPSASTRPMPTPMPAIEWSSAVRKPFGVEPLRSGGLGLGPEHAHDR